MLHPRKRKHHPVGPVKQLPVFYHRIPPNLSQPLLRAQQGVAQGIVLVRRRVHQLGQDEVGLAPNLGNLVPRRLNLRRHLVLGHARLENGLREQLHRVGHGAVERGGLVHHGLARRGALEVAAQGLDALEHGVGAQGRRRLEGQAVHDVRHAPEGRGLEAGAALDVDADAGKGAREGLGGDAQAVGEGCDFVEVGGFLQGERRKLAPAEKGARIHVMLDGLIPLGCPRLIQWPCSVWARRDRWRGAESCCWLGWPWPDCPGAAAQLIVAAS